MIPKELCVLLLVVVPFISAGPYPNFRSDLDFISLSDTPEWWQAASFYQIYPRSFKDSDGDGIGDLKGITESLSYLKEIGINATWLSPIFSSPMKDFGYDISNFYTINPDYGTMDDFHNLLKRAKELGLKIILDFVPNHTSDQHNWFKLSEKKDENYKNFYVWHPGRRNPENPEKPLPPSNWISVFRKSAWEWSPIRKEFYLHQFAKQQPDLNYREAKVKNEMKEVLRFWLKKGVAGFRIDAVPHVFECKKDNDPFPDEKINPDITDPDDYGHLIHDCTKDQPETLDLVYDWREVLDEFATDGEPRIMMTEAYSDISVLMKYYGGKGREGAQIPFNFLLISNLNKDSKASDFVGNINMWLQQMPKKKVANWVMGNHDKSRIGSRFGKERMDLINMIIHTLPGAGITYNGEEIGMTDVWISWNDTVDPAACNSNPKIYEIFSRDPERTPFQWNDEKNAGFSTGNKTWLPVAPDYKEVNVKRQRGVANSHLNIYKRIQRLRQTKTLRQGDTNVKALSNSVVAIHRSLRGEESYLTLANIEDNTVAVNLAGFGLPAELEYVVVNSYSRHRIGEVLTEKALELWPYEGVVLKTRTKLTSIAGYYFYESQ